jgi:hypothetical protein
MYWGNTKLVNIFEEYEQLHSNLRFFSPWNCIAKSKTLPN